MKAVSIFLASLAAQSLMAAEPVKYICVEVEKRDLMMALTQNGVSDQGGLREGVRYSFGLELYKDKRSTQPFLSQDVSVKTEDVMFFFKGKGVSGTIYMDELDQSVLRIGKKEYRMDCSLDPADR